MGTADVNRESTRGPSRGSIRGSVTAVPGTRSWAGGSNAACNGAITRFYGSPPVAFVGADGPWTRGAGSNSQGVCTRLALELAKDSVLDFSENAHEILLVSPKRMLREPFVGKGVTPRCVFVEIP